MAETVDGIIINEAQPEDYEGLLALYSHLIQEDLPRDEQQGRASLDQLIQRDGLHQLVARLNGELVAACTLIVVPNLTRGCAPYAFLENVVTHADHRNKGYGRLMVDEALRTAWNEGAYKVMLLSGSWNDDAHRFYDQAGFERTKIGFEMRAPGYPKRTKVS